MKLSGLFFQALILVLFSGIFIPGITSCRHDDDITGLDTLCFDRDILPIFQASCGDPSSSTIQCHNPSSAGEYTFETYSGIMKGVTPGDVMKSEVYSVLIDVWSSENLMPPDRPLSLQNRSVIKVWIEQGAKETSPACP